MVGSVGSGTSYRVGKNELAGADSESLRLRHLTGSGVITLIGTSTADLEEGDYLSGDVQLVRHPSALAADDLDKIGPNSELAFVSKPVAWVYNLPMRFNLSWPGITLDEDERLTFRFVMYLGGSASTHKFQLVYGIDWMETKSIQ